jgi:hypothetical protein
MNTMTLQLKGYCAGHFSTSLRDSKAIRVIPSSYQLALESLPFAFALI